MNLELIKGQLENKDYVSTLTDPKSGKRDFIVSMDMAKELCMVADWNKDGVIIGCNYKLNNEAARLNRLKQIAC